MDLQADAALETMAQAGPPTGPSSSASSSTATTPTTPGALPTQYVKGYPKEITQNPVEEKFLCGYCDLILRHPVQSDCGHRFCRSCRDDLGRLQQPVKCKACEKEGVPEAEQVLELQSMFDDKAATREMKKIPTKCINPGCQWKGLFSEYSTNHEINCDKRQVECSLCQTLVSQARLSHHETKQCPKRTTTCQYCKEKLLFEQQEKHLTNCPSLPVRCGQCSKQVPQSELKFHKEEECIHRTVECPVPDCNIKLPLDQFPSHFSKSQQSTQKHMLYLFNKLMQLEKEIAQLEVVPAGAVGGTAEGASPTTHEVQPVSAGSSGSTAVASNGTDGAEGGAVAASALGTEDKQKLKLHEDLMAVLHGEILRCIRQTEALNAVIERDGKIAKDNQKKIETLERNFGTMEAKIMEFLTKQGPPDPNEHGVLTDHGDGSCTWRIDNFTQVRRAACNGTRVFICSQPFMTGSCGYKMRLRFFADGDGEHKGKSFSVFIQLMKGPSDDILPWPFAGKIYVMIVDLQNFKDHKTISFSALPQAPAFQRPKETPNPASGCALMNLRQFSENLDKYLMRETMVLRINVGLPENVGHRLDSLQPGRVSGARR